MVLWQMPALILVIAYLIGSIPFGVVTTRLAGAGDVRQIGSGNIGATNVLRTGRKGLAAATLLLDGAKGAVAVWIGWRMGGNGMFDNAGAAAGVMAFIGHCYPVWLRFAGGKGVATMLGVTLALHWPAGLVFALVWLAMMLITRISSAGGMSAAVAAMIAMPAFGRLDLVAPTAAMALILLWRHRANIGRLLRGTEPRIGKTTPVDCSSPMAQG